MSKHTRQERVGPKKASPQAPAPVAEDPRVTIAREVVGGIEPDPAPEELDPPVLPPEEGGGVTLREKSADSMDAADLPPTTPEQALQEADQLAKLIEESAERAADVAAAAKDPEIKKVLAAPRVGTHVLVNNTTHSLFALGVPNADGNPRAQHALSRTIRLLPGVNRVPVADWAAAVKQKMVQVHISLGHFKELGVKGLEKLPEKEAIALVDETVEKALLEDWLRAEDAGAHRIPVLEALSVQLEKIAPTKRKADDEDSDEDQE